MLLISRHLTEYPDFIIPKNTVIRINMAWESSLELLENHLIKLEDNNLPVFIDIPTNRMKPPNFKYTIDEILPVVQKYNIVKYIAVSNVEYPEQLKEYLETFPKTISIVPKIETLLGVANIQHICQVLREPKTIMIDHDDLLNDLLKHRIEPHKLYSYFVNPVINYCKQQGIIALKTAGVVFSDE